MSNSATNTTVRRANLVTLWASALHHSECQFAGALLHGKGLKCHWVSQSAHHILVILGNIFAKQHKLAVHTTFEQCVSCLEVKCWEWRSIGGFYCKWHGDTYNIWNSGKSGFRISANPAVSVILVLIHFYQGYILQCSESELDEHTRWWQRPTSSVTKRFHVTTCELH